MKICVKFLLLVMVLLTASACSDDSELDSLESAVQVDNSLKSDLGDLDLELELDLNLALPLDRLKFQLATEIIPSFEIMSEMSEQKLHEYDLTLNEFFPDPNDPRRGTVGLLVAELEELYAAGYEVRLLSPDEPYPPVASSGTKTGECLLVAVGVKGVVDAVRNGNTGKILTQTVLKGVIKNATLKTAMGWIGWAWFAWEFGTCMGEPPRLADEDKPYDEERAKWDKKYRNKMMRHIQRELVWQVQQFREQYPDSFYMVLDTTSTN